MYRTLYQPGNEGLFPNPQDRHRLEVHLQKMQTGNVRIQSVEQLSHRCVDSITYKVCVQSFRSVLPGRISAAIAAEWVIPEHPIVSTSASWIIPSLTFNVSLHVPCWGAHQPTPCVKPEISLISLAFTHFASSGIGAAPWLTP